MKALSADIIGWTVVSVLVSVLIVVALVMGPGKCVFSTVSEHVKATHWNDATLVLDAPGHARGPSTAGLAQAIAENKAALDRIEALLKKSTKADE